ncbi:MAG: hypothetical protein ACLP5H_20595 [Desulfomonilaceae bacterium]
MSEDVKTLDQEGVELRKRVQYLLEPPSTPATEQSLAICVLLLENRLARIQRVLEANAQAGK